jgi:hypothetical protein
MDRETPPPKPRVTGVRFQFHATPEELVDLARSWRDDHELHLAGEQLFPNWRAFSIEGDVAREKLDAVDFLALRRVPFDLTPLTHIEFGRSNDETLYMRVAKVNANELGEAAIGGYTRDPAEAARWRRLIRELREASHKGASVRNWAATANAPSHRHTSGAHRLAERGVRMVSFPGGGTEYRFDDLRGSFAETG